MSENPQPFPPPPVPPNTPPFGDKAGDGKPNVPSTPSAGKGSDGDHDGTHGE